MDPVMDDTTSTINELNYMRPIGAYKPHFAGVPDTYYPLTCSETLRGVLILFFTISLLSQLIALTLVVIDLIIRIIRC